MRKVTIVSAQAEGNKEIMTAAATWGQLEGELVGQNINVAGMKVMVRETKANLEHRDAVLPTTDFVLFLTPGKVKSGLGNF